MNKEKIQAEFFSTRPKPIHLSHLTWRYVMTDLMIKEKERLSGSLQVLPNQYQAVYLSHPWPLRQTWMCIYKTVTPEERGYSGYESSDIYFDDCGNEIYNEYVPVGVYNTALVFSDGKRIVLVPPENLTSFCYYHQDLLFFCSDDSYDKGEIKFQIRNHPEANNLNLDIKLIDFHHKYVKPFWQFLLDDLAIDCSETVSRLCWIFPDLFKQNTEFSEERLIVVNAANRAGCCIPMAILALHEQMLQEEQL